MYINADWCFQKKKSWKAFERKRHYRSIHKSEMKLNIFREYYGHLYPAVFLSYEREAYFMKDGSDFRVTFDENILYRRENFSLGSSVYGTPLLEEGQTLMEIKTSGGIPLWMSQILTQCHIYKTSFSKYGLAYKNMIAEKIQGGIKYA